MSNFQTPSFMGTQPLINSFLTPSFSTPIQPYNFSLQTPLPNFNLGLGTRMIADQSNFSTKFKNPVHTEVIKVRSESSIRSYNGLYHTFILPNLGDYAHGFNLNSFYLMKGVKAGQLMVDCLGNYIDCATLNLNSTMSVFSRIDGIAKVEIKSPDELTASAVSVIKLDFLDLPLLTKYADNGSFQVSLKFTQPPPMDYELVYEVMFTDDKSYVANLHKEDFSILYQARQVNNQRKAIEMTFKGGKVSYK
jgi:hypothetical protein